MEKLSNPQVTIETIKKHGFDFQKKFGQNFLIDGRVLDKIILAADIQPQDCVLEIGPGIGTMTQYLAEHAGKVIAVEIDEKLIPILEETLQEYSNVTVIQGDILKIDVNRLVQEQNQGRPVKVVANLPYYITTPIIMGLFEQHVPIDNITVMVQKEVADRMQVGPGTKDYGALSLAVQCSICGDPADLLCGAAGKGAGREADVSVDSGILQSASEDTGKRNRKCSRSSIHKGAGGTGIDGAGAECYHTRRNLRTGGVCKTE